MKRRTCLLLVLLTVLLPCLPARAEDPLPMREYAFTRKASYKYESETLRFRIERFIMGGAECFLTKVWMADPARQIRKRTSEWKTEIRRPIRLAQEIPEAALIINGSGYVSPAYPWIPENYPGESADYYYTPLGSLTVTDGQVYRDLEGVPYTGLTLEADGLHMYIGAENAGVLANGPTETWSFYEECPILLANEDILPEKWDFAGKRAPRTVIARADRNNYLILSVSSREKPGLSLRKVSEFFRKNFDTEWVYNLDGGLSSALLCRRPGAKKRTTIMGGSGKVADIMAFTELPAEAP